MYQRMEKIQFTNKSSDLNGDLGLDIGGSAFSIEEIKKDIKRLEQEIDHKLSTYSNFSERLEQWTEEDPGVGGFGDIRPSSALNELETILEKLAERNKQLNESNATTNIRLHHRSKLDDYTQEFRRLKTNLNQAWERAQLMRGRKYEALPDRSVNMDNLIRERGSIYNSLNIASDFISQAVTTKEMVENQNRILGGSTRKLTGLSRQLPSLNQIMSKIRSKKNRNTMILGFVISFCICFLLWWWWSSI